MKKRYQISLLTVLVIPFVLLIIVAIGFTGLVSFRNGEKAVEDLSIQVRKELISRIESQIENFLKEPHILNQININSFDLEQLSLDNVEGIQSHLWKQVELFENINLVAIGIEENGACYGYSRLVG